MNHSRTALDDDESSPLQSKRSSIGSNSEGAPTQNQSVMQPSSLLEELGARLDEALENCFQHLRFVCASHPWVTLFIGGCIVVTLGHGIKYLQLTTDPVQLWASPMSRC